MENKTICGNPWCKAMFFYSGEEIPRQCYKCHSFNSDLSGGVSWVTKEYTEPRNDGKAHEISINISTGNQKSTSTVGGALGQFLRDLLKR